ncbi:MAG: hypothetical protein IV094_03750 [Vitreoscilla sp.]|nr:hypothetical protein [Vitreoscilla sp.]
MHCRIRFHPPAHRAPPTCDPARTAPAPAHLGRQPVARRSRAAAVGAGQAAGQRQAQARGFHAEGRARGPAGVRGRAERPGHAAVQAPCRGRLGAPAGGAGRWPDGRERAAAARRPVRLHPQPKLDALLDLVAEGDAPPALVLFDPGFHEGVVGIVAGRMKDRLHRPTFVFAVGADGLLKGSGRSIPGFHLRDALDLVSKRHPGVLRKFGGHAMAAGCTVAEADIGIFDAALQAVAREWLLPAALQRQLATDGPLALEYFNADTVARLDAEVWGQGFEAPVFCDEVEVIQQRLVGAKHLKLRLRHQGQLRDAIWFGHTDSLPAKVRLAYRLSLDEFQGQQRVQMVVEAAV